MQLQRCSTSYKSCRRGRWRSAGERRQAQTRIMRSSAECAQSREPGGASGWSSQRFVRPPSSTKPFFVSDRLTTAKYMPLLVPAQPGCRPEHDRVHRSTLHAELTDAPTYPLRLLLSGVDYRPERPPWGEPPALSQVQHFAKIMSHCINDSAQIQRCVC